MEKNVVKGLCAGGDVEDWTKFFDEKNDSTERRASFNSTASQPKSPSSRVPRLLRMNKNSITVENSDDEDWDAEFDRDSTSQSQLHEGNFQILVSGYRHILHGQSDSLSSSEGGNSINVPRKCRLLDIVAKKNSVKIIRYPKPPQLYCLHGEDGFSSKAEDEVESWLCSVVSSKSSPFLSAEGMARIHTLTDVKEIFCKSLAIFDQNCMKKMIEMVWLTERAGGTSNDIWPLLEYFFYELNQQHPLYSTVSASQAQQSKGDEDIAGIVMEVLCIAGRLWWQKKKDNTYIVSSKPLMIRDKSINALHFSDMLSIALSCFPRYRQTISLIELRTVAHHLEELVDCGISYQWVAQGSDLQEELNESTGERIQYPHTIPWDAIKCYKKIYLESKLSIDASSPLCSPDDTSGVNSLSIYTSVLMDLQLCLGNISPLTLSSSPDLVEYFPDIDECSEVFGQFDINHDMEQNPMIRQLLAPLDGSTIRNIYQDTFNVFLDSSYRIDLLLNAYSALNAQPFLLKAQVAFTIAQHLVHNEQDFGLAEQLLYECIQLLDKSQNIPHFNGAIITHIGTHALELFGEVLVRNGKYRYGILSFQAAITSYKLRERQDFEKLNRRLCGLCLDHGDSARAIPYYLKILQSSKQKNNINEFVYISQIVARMLLEQGKFPAAESYLQVALSYLQEIYTGVPVASRLSVDSFSHHRRHRRYNSGDIEAFLMHYVNLHLEIVEVYSARGRYHKSRDLLQTILNGRIPTGKKVEIEMTLAEVLLKLREMSKCTKLLMDMNEESIELSLKGTKKRGVDIVLSIRYIICRARCHLYSGDPCNALRWIAIAIVTCNTSNLSQLARLHHLRGKIYQYILLHGHEEEDTPSVVWLAKNFGLHDSTKLNVYVLLTLDACARESFDSLLAGLGNPTFDECEKAYTKALEYFEAVEDTFHRTKTLQCIARLRISRVMSENMSILVRDDPSIRPVIDSLSTCEPPTIMSVELSGEVGNPMLILLCLLNLGELRVLQVEKAASLTIFSECYRLLHSVFLCELKFSQVRLRESTVTNGTMKDDATMHEILLVPIVRFSPGMIIRLFSLTERLIRLMFLLGDMKESPRLLSAYLFLQTEAHIIQSRMLFNKGKRNAANEWGGMMNDDSVSETKQQGNSSKGSSFSLGQILSGWFEKSQKSSMEGSPLVYSSGNSIELSNTTIHQVNSYKRRSNTCDIKIKELPIYSEDNTHLVRRRASSEPHPGSNEIIRDATSSIHRGQSNTDVAQLEKYFTQLGCSGMYDMVLGDQDSYFTVDNYHNERFWESFYRFKLFSRQYTGGKISLDEFSKNNIKALHELISVCDTLEVPLYQESIHSQAKECHALSQSRVSKPHFFIPLSIDNLVCVYRPRPFGEYCSSDQERMVDICDDASDLSHVMTKMQDLMPKLTFNDTYFPEDCEIASLIKIMGHKVILKLVACLMLEQSLIITGLSLELIAVACGALLKLIRPLEWKSFYLPYATSGSADILFSVLTRCHPVFIGMSPLLLKEMQLLLGIRSDYSHLSEWYSSIIILDLDHQRIQRGLDFTQINRSPHFPKRDRFPLSYLQSINQKVEEILKRNNKMWLWGTESPKNEGFREVDYYRIACAVQEGLLSMMASILFGYEAYIVVDIRGTKVFDAKGFLQSRQKAWREFLVQLVERHSFHSFVYGNLTQKVVTKDAVSSFLVNFQNSLHPT